MGCTGGGEVTILSVDGRRPSAAALRVVSSDVGDVNRDGVREISDASLARSFLVGLSQPEADEAMACDVFPPAGCDLADVVVISRDVRAPALAPGLR